MVYLSPGPLPYFRVWCIPGAIAIVTVGAPLHQPTQEGHLAQPLGAGIGRQVGGNQTKVECALQAQRSCRLHHPRVTGKTAGLLGPRAQVSPTPAGEPAIHFGQAAPGPHRGQRSGQASTRRHGVVHVVGGHQAHAAAHRYLGQGIVADPVEWVSVVPQLHVHMVSPERVDQPIQCPPGRRRPFPIQGHCQWTLAASGEHRPGAGR